MIGKLKRKLTILASVSMLLLMTVLILIINMINFSAVVSKSDTILDMLSQPNAPFFDENPPPEKKDIKPEDFIPRGMSPEVPYESRFFTVLVTSEGKILEPNFSRIISVNNDSSQKYIEQAIGDSKDRGFAGQFRYIKISDNKMTRILFLDCGRKLDAFRTFCWTSIGVGLLGCIVVFVFFIFAAGRIVRPIAESYEKQKRFITDAGHEIKTPLTIINANADLLECEGKREEIDEILNQTIKLTELTNHLVLLSKMEETEPKIKKVDLPLSDIVLEAVNSFRTLSASYNVKMTEHIVPGLSLTGSPDTINQLMSILLENAVKYTPEGGTVTVFLSVARKSAVLSVVNTSKYTVNKENLPYIFDRFYRTDASRNSATGGYGIGLSIAKAIVEAHNGNIVAETNTGNEFIVTVTIPLS